MPREAMATEDERMTEVAAMCCSICRGTLLDTDEVLNDTAGPAHLACLRDQYADDSDVDYLSDGE